MTDDERRETHARIAAQAADLEAERDRKCNAAISFLAFCCGYLKLEDPDWKPKSADLAFDQIQLLRRELLPIVQRHFSHLLDQEDPEANAVRREETAP